MRDNCCLVLAAARPGCGDAHGQMTFATGTRLGPYEILGQLGLDPVFSTGTPRPLFDTAASAYARTAR
jgi:hypothetical protein